MSALFQDDLVELLARERDDAVNRIAQSKRDWHRRLIPRRLIAGMTEPFVNGVAKR
jgi:hypothetical protein